MNNIPLTQTSIALAVAVTFVLIASAEAVRFTQAWKAL